MAFIFTRFGVFLRLWLLTQNGNKSVLEKLERGAPVLVNIQTKQICLEQSTDCWRVDEKTTYRRAFLLYGDI
jgi:hypothetical protein